MAHLQPIPNPKCSWLLCPNRATVTLINHRSCPVGDYCARHGQKALDKFLKETRPPQPSEGEPK